MELVINLALPFFALIFLGILGGRLFKIDESGLAWLNTFIIYFALPSLFYLVLSKTPLEQLTNWSFILITITSTFLTLALAFIVARIFVTKDMAEATIQGLLGGYANVGYMGIGLSIAALGDAAAAPAALIFAFDVALVFTLAPIMMTLAGKEEGRPLDIARKISIRVLTNPFIVSTLVGLTAAVFQFQAPKLIISTMESLSVTAAPCALFALGVTVSLKPVKRIPTELPALTIIKLLIHPIIVYDLLMIVGGFDPVWVQTAILMACLPPAATIYVITKQYNVYVQRASSAILIVTLLSMVTVTGWLYLVKNNVLAF